MNMKLFGMLLAVGIFVSGAVVYAERARADTVEYWYPDDREPYCTPYGGSRRCY